MVYKLKLISLDALTIKSNEIIISINKSYIFVFDQLGVRMCLSLCATLVSLSQLKTIPLSPALCHCYKRIGPCY